MTVEQTLKQLESIKTSRVLASLLNESDHKAIDQAITIIKAAQAVAEDASVEMRKEGVTPVAMERLLSLLSPEQQPKKEAK